MITTPVRGLFLPQHLVRNTAPTSGAVISPREDPTPNPEVERKLREENARWFLKFMHFPKPHWAVCETWRENDPRRQLVQNGTIAIDAAFDMVAHCPVELSADDAVAYVRRNMIRVTDPAKQAEKQLEGIYRQQAERRQQIKDELKSDLIHQASRMTSHEAQLLAGATTAHPMIHGADMTE